MPRCPLVPALIALAAALPAAEPLVISGIHPQLAMHNSNGECGTGAVVPWADRLWVITYAPHAPKGSDDKLYEITPELTQIVRPESVGGTPADRLIHRESGQLIIGPYFIDAHGAVRAVQPAAMPGRLTAVARHLTDPAGKVYFATMEEGFYAVDVKTLAVETLYPDSQEQKPGFGADLPGWHGKGLYSGQGVLVYANNGEKSPAAMVDPHTRSGALMEWNGADWSLVRRNQFTEITGPDGLNGSADPAREPIWSIGWDTKSLLLALRENGSWTFFRLPKASRSYDGAHGFYTEWPRIRDIGSPGAVDRLMTMHGMFWRFPAEFSLAHHPGPQPRSAYLKILGDFARWGGQVVLGCDDTAASEFLNKRTVKGKVPAPLKSNSNLWFVAPDDLDHFGPTTAEGGVWQAEPVKAGQHSEAMLFAGWQYRTAWFSQDGDAPATFSVEADAGDGAWTELARITVPAHGSVMHAFAGTDAGAWLRVTADHDVPRATVHLTYANDEQRPAGRPDPIFAGLASIDSPSPPTAGLLRSTWPTLTIATPRALYEVDAECTVKPTAGAQSPATVADELAVPKGMVAVEASSVLVVDGRHRRWRLPKGEAAFDGPTRDGGMRLEREVVTERDLFDCHGTFYELPADNAGGFAVIRPLASHRLRIADYCSHRGMLAMTGIDPAAAPGNPHVRVSADGQAAVWLGAIDDLWRLGRPTGQGGPWADSSVTAQVPSDPYLIWGYAQRSLALSHAAATTVTMRVELDLDGEGRWLPYVSIPVAAGATATHVFPAAVQARWVRIVADADCTATARFLYQ